MFEMVALAVHVHPTLSSARNDSVTGDEERNLVQTERGIQLRGNKLVQPLQILCQKIFICKKRCFKSVCLLFFCHFTHSLNRDIHSLQVLNF